MKQYELRKTVSEKELLDSGFETAGLQMYRLYRNLYKNLILMIVFVDLEEPEAEGWIQIQDRNTGQEYRGLYCEYGKSLVREKVRAAYEETMDLLSEKGIFLPLQE